MIKVNSIWDIFIFFLFKIVAAIIPELIWMDLWDALVLIIDPRAETKVTAKLPFKALKDVKESSRIKIADAEMLWEFCLLGP